MKNRKARILNFKGRKTINLTTEVEIDQCVDVDITIELDDIMDDIMDELDSYVDDPMDLRGIELKDHLCDLCGLSHRSSNEQIIAGIESLLKFC